MFKLLRFTHREAVVSEKLAEFLLVIGADVVQFYTQRRFGYRVHTAANVQQADIKRIMQLVHHKVERHLRLRLSIDNKILSTQLPG